MTVLNLDICVCIFLSVGRCFHCALRWKAQILAFGRFSIGPKIKLCTWKIHSIQVALQNIIITFHFPLDWCTRQAHATRSENNKLKWKKRSVWNLSTPPLKHTLTSECTCFCESSWKVNSLKAFPCCGHLGLIQRYFYQSKMQRFSGRNGCTHLPLCEHCDPQMCIALEMSKIVMAKDRRLRSHTFGR